MASKDHFDPGWNDPPTFTYDKATAIQSAAASKKGSLLNKRVAFPISGNVSGATENHTPGDLDKPPMIRPPPISSLSTPVCNPHHPPENSSQELPAEERNLEKVLNNFQIHEIKDDEILKRIKIMEKMWQTDKLDKHVQQKIYELSEALINGDADSADHIQKSLMVDKVSQCSSWMSGIRHLINQKRLANS